MSLAGDYDVACMTGEVFATIDHHGHVVDALRRRIDHLGITFETAEAISGLQSNCLTKIAGSCQFKRMSVFTLLLLVEALGLTLTLNRKPRGSEAGTVGSQ